MSFSLRRFVSRRWFLILLALGVVLAAIWPATLAWTRHTPPRWVMPLTLFLSAISLETRRFAESLRSPWPALASVALGYSIPPLLGWGFGSLLSGDFRSGLLICSAAPCTLASAVIWTRLAGGDDATALLATFASTGLSWLATTAWLALTTGQVVAMGFGSIMRDLALILLLPVIVGQTIRAVPAVAKFADRHKQAIGVCARLLVLTILVRALHDLAVYLRGSSEPIGIASLMGIIAACLATHLIALGIAWLVGGWFRFERPIRIAVALASSQKSLPVSLVLLDLVFPQLTLAVVPLLVYHAGQLTVDSIIAERLVFSRREGGD